MGRVKKIKKYIFPAIGVLVVLLTALNFYLSNRLERYLKKELSRRTAEATDGFYNLSFEDLSISFFKGELKIEGIELKPDSTVFLRWAEMDSLPQTYVKAQVGVIDFKGVNLIWQWNYKKLYFNSFEIKDPRIALFDSYNSGRYEAKTHNTKSKSLYEVIAPYINVLSVRTLNLENASVSYTVENPVTPIVYALTDVSFHAYGFRLDENSSQSGKLLYCDNFDFVTNQPQVLLANNDFLLETDSIRLSTQDSIIYIRKINLTPQEQLWEEKRQKPDSYASAFLKTVEVNGIRFKREKALNYLTARSFDITSSDIRFFNLREEEETPGESKTEETQVINADSLVQALSLYDIISPVLHEVAIRSIAIRDAKVEYSQKVKKQVEVYKLDNFNFRANDFRVDSLAEVKHGLWYSDSYAFEASGIEGMMTARNHRLRIDRMALDTETGDLSIENIRLNPIVTRSRNDYISGRIDSISIKELQYDKGLSAGLLKIDRPDISYYKSPSVGKENKEEKTPVDTKADIEGLLNPFFRYLSIRNIRLNQANVTLKDKSLTGETVYKLKNFNFYATGFLVNDSTNRSDGWFFAYDRFGFSFSNFDNYLPGKTYRLAIRKGQFSSGDGSLRLQEVRLQPQDSLGGKTPDVSVSLKTSLISVTGLNRLPEKLSDHLEVGSVYIASPHVGIAKKESFRIETTLKDLQLNSVRWDSTIVSLGAARLSDPLLHYSVGDYSLAIDSTDLYLEGFTLNTARRTFDLKAIRFNTQHLSFPLDNGFYTLNIGKVNWDNTNLDVQQIHLVSTYPKMEFAYRQPQHKDWFDVRVGRLSLNGIDLPAYISSKTVKIDRVQIDDAELQNFKNQQIAVPRHIVPMIYSGLQKAPVKMDISRLDVNNFSVVYEELSKKGKEPGKLFFTGMNGTFTGFTNIVSRPDQYIRLDADGKMMGTGSFTATWMLPVDSLNDRFLLNAQMKDFDLTALNQLITPLASAKVESGRLTDFTFQTEASSKGATVDMLFLYRDLKAEIMKEKDGEMVDKKFLSGLANLILKHDNPDYPEKGDHAPRHSHLTIERDPYHSTFNYLWQILRPPLIESVGVSQKTQHVAKEVSGFFTKVKRFFHPKKKSKKESGQSGSKDELISQ